MKELRGVKTQEGGGELKQSTGISICSFYIMGNSGDSNYNFTIV